MSLVIFFPLSIMSVGDSDDFADCPLPDEDDLELDRFSFVDTENWTDTVEASVCPRTLEKLRFVHCLFEEWKTQRNLRRVSDPRVPDKDLLEFSADELNK